MRAAICSGDSPRRRQSLIASSLAAAAGSSASIPRLDETRTESAHSCAARASQKTWGRRLQPIARYRPHPLQQRGHAARRGQAADRSAEASTRSPRLSLGAVTNLCDATSALTVEGDLPSPLAISLHDALRSSILWTVSRSCLVSLP